MQNYHLELGARRSVHRASLGWLWLLLLSGAPVFLVTVVAAVFAFNSFAFQANDSGGGSSGGPGNFAGAFACLGSSGLLLTILGAVCFSGFRKWNATRQVRLIIYEKGFTYESKGNLQSSAWVGIKEIEFKRIEVKTKHSASRQAKVIRSIVKMDGSVISLAETLDLEKITQLINTAREKT